jgi:hypothetical protein
MPQSLDPNMDFLGSRVAIGPKLTQIVHWFRKYPIMGVGNDGFEFWGGLGGVKTTILGDFQTRWQIFRLPRIISGVIFLDPASKNTTRNFFWTFWKIVPHYYGVNWVFLRPFSNVLCRGNSIPAPINFSDFFWKIIQTCIFTAFKMHLVPKFSDHGVGSYGGRKKPLGGGDTQLGGVTFLKYSLFRLETKFFGISDLDLPLDNIFVFA